MRTFVVAFALLSLAVAQVPPAGPLADPRRDPGAPQRAAPGSGEPDLRGGTADWWWGELLHGNTYPAKLKITNDCASAETVSIFVTNLPLEAPPSVTVPAKGSEDVTLTITIDQIPETELPRPRGNAYIAETIDGFIVAWHPWTPKCLPRRDKWNAGGFVIAPGPPDYQKVGGDDCGDAWELGSLSDSLGKRFAAAESTAATEPPKENDEEKKCTEELRDLAVDLRKGIDAVWSPKEPEKWEWLPSEDDLRKASLGDLLAFKARADAGMRRAPGAPAAKPKSATVVVDSKAAADGVESLRADIRRLALNDPSLNAPAQQDLDGQLEALSLKQLEALRDRLRAREDRKRGVKQ